jgi:predicted dehydrogenase
MEGYVEDGSKYQATPWRTVPDYQGGKSSISPLTSADHTGFLLDGGVHQTALLRAVLPVRPASILARNALHRKLLLPHDTVVGLALPPSSAITDPHGPSTKLSTALNTTGIVENGTSQPQGTILMSFACPNIPSEGKSGNGLFITCLNGSVLISSLPNGKLSIRVTGAEGSGVKNELREEKPSGVEAEIGAFGRAIDCAKRGVENDEENWGDVRGGLWDIAVIEALLTSQGSEVVLEDAISSA